MYVCVRNSLVEGDNKKQAKFVQFMRHYFSYQMGRWIMCGLFAVQCVVGQPIHLNLKLAVGG